ncbi:MAG: tRNA (guanosine(46)-N7)-methyltransferase TrmB [Pseudomonadales bacterium]
MSEETNTPQRRPIRSFVLRGGRITDGQRKAFNANWPRYGLELENGMLDYAGVFQREANTVLEIGFGMGDSLLQMARTSPESNFIGVEVHPPGVGRLLAAIDHAKLINLRIFKADALDVLQKCIPDGSLTCVQIFFPDPWHKKRHHKRRLIQPDFVALASSKLTAKGVLHIATDWQPYAEHSMQVLQANPQLRNSAGADNFAPRPERRPLTKFEQRGQRLGHGVWDLIFESQ